MQNAAIWISVLVLQQNKWRKRNRGKATNGRKKRQEIISCSCIPLEIWFWGLNHFARTHRKKSLSCIAPSSTHFVIKSAIILQLLKAEKSHEGEWRLRCRRSSSPFQLHIQAAEQRAQKYGNLNCSCALFVWGEKKQHEKRFYCRKATATTFLYRRNVMIITHVRRKIYELRRAHITLRLCLAPSIGSISALPTSSNAQNRIRSVFN